MHQVEDECDLSRQPDGCNRLVAFLPNEDHAQHVQGGEGELLDDDGDGDAAEFRDVVRVAAGIDEVAKAGHTFS
jgi:hypothetical protein